MPRELLQDERPVILAGDWNVVPWEDTVDARTRATANDALLQPQTPRPPGGAFSTRAGRMPFARCYPREDRLCTFWDYTAGCWQRDAGFRIDHLLLLAGGGGSAAAPAWTKGEGRKRKRAITRRRGWSSPRNRHPDNGRVRFRHAGLDRHPPCLPLRKADPGSRPG